MSMYETAVLPYELQELLDREIKGEQIKWSCQPSYSRLVMKNFWSSLFSGVVFIGFSVALVFMANRDTQRAKNLPLPIKILLPATGIVFGLYGMATPFFSARKAKDTVYAITDKRALIIVRRPSTTDISSFGADKIKNVEKRILNDGSGDLILEKRSEGKYTEEIGFFGVPEVSRIESMLKEIT